MRRLTVACAMALLCGSLAASARAQGPAVYVALGDSYTAAPLVPNQRGAPIGCERSDHNYPSLVAHSLGVRTFVDVSCSGARTKDMTAAQTGLLLGGTNPPQFDALGPDAELVTIGIGGNDVGLVAVAEKCAQLGLTAPTASACRGYYAPAGQDSVAGRIEQTRPKIAAVLRGIHQRSPHARVAIVGYPDVLPKNGGSCYPTVPLSPDDVRYLDGLIVRINAMIADVASANAAEFIDTYTDSGGHDVCTLPPTRWFEGLVPTEAALPLHPNAQGEASMARSAIALLSRPPAVGGAMAPVLSRLRVSPRRGRVGRAVAVSYRLNRAASVSVTVRRVLGGRRSNGRCARPSRGNIRGRRCALYSGPLESVKLAGRAGDNRLKLGVRPMGGRPGRFRLTATPAADGLSGSPAAFFFRLVRPRRMTRV